MTSVASQHGVVFLHGFLGAGADWKTVADHLGRHVFSPDLPGHGLNREPPPDFEGLMAWLAARLPERAHVVGYSMGGRIAQHYAVRFPERVASLTVISASPGIEDEDQRAARRRSDAVWADKLRTMSMSDFLSAWYAQPVFASLRDKTELLSQIIERRSFGEPDLLADALVKWGQGVVPSLWRTHLDVPRQWIFGEQDVAYVKLARNPENPLPGNIHIIKTAGHTVHLEQPAAVADSIRNFIEEHES